MASYMNVTQKLTLRTL